MASLHVEKAHLSLKISRKNVSYAFIDTGAMIRAS